MRDFFSCLNVAECYHLHGHIAVGISPKRTVLRVSCHSVWSPESGRLCVLSRTTRGSGTYFGRQLWLTLYIHHVPVSICVEFVEGCFWEDMGNRLRSRQ
jgi:hypothetical protein